MGTQHAWRSRFRLARMDCGAEEAMVRMKLDPLPTVSGLEFDLPRRELTVLHSGDVAPIAATIAELHFAETHLETLPAETVVDAAVTGSSVGQRESVTLWIVLGINAGFFLFEIAAGLLSGSLGLVADSLDMLADASVYALSLLAVGATAARKLRVAHLSGWFQVLLATLGFVEVLRRVVFGGPNPDYRTMIAVALLALAANVTSLVVLARAQSDDAHMKASWIFTSNDVAANLGVVLAGVIVLFTGSPVPDLIIGSIVFAVVMRGAVRILRLG